MPSGGRRFPRVPIGLVPPERCKTSGPKGWTCQSRLEVKSSRRGGRGNTRRIPKFLGVPRQTRQLGEDEAGDVAAFDISEHPPGFGVFLDRFAGDTGQV